MRLILKAAIPPRFSNRFNLQHESLKFKSFSSRQHMSMFSRTQQGKALQGRRSMFSGGNYGNDEADTLIYGIIGANACGWLLWQGMPSDFMYNHFTSSAYNLSQFRFHTLFTK